MNIGLMFVHEPIETDRQSKQKETDRLIEGKLDQVIQLQTLLLI